MNRVDKLLDTVASKVPPKLMSRIGEVLQQPLLVHENYMRSYVRSALMFDSKGDLSNGMPSEYYPEIKTGVIEVNGALMARMETDECGYTLASYEELINKMESFVERGADFIVARFNSGGGVASQMFDASRKIASMRGRVRLIASIDDYAYSSAYGLASAFDKIYVTDTSGALSIGVMLRHVSKIPSGDSVITYFKAGSKKLDGASDMPLTESAKNDIQGEVDRLYGLFTKLVSDNLNLSLEQVVKTEAGTLHGDNIITQGFAHAKGTFKDVINEIYNGGEMNIDEIASAEKRLAKQEQKLAEARALIEEAKLELDKPEAKANVEAKPEANVEAKVENEEQEVSTDEAEAEKAIEAIEKAKEANASKEQELAKAEKRKSLITNMCNVAGVKGGALEAFLSSDMSIAEIGTILTSMTANNHSISSFEEIDEGGETKSKDEIKQSWAKAFGVNKRGNK